MSAKTLVYHAFCSTQPRAESDACTFVILLPDFTYLFPDVSRQANRHIVWSHYYTTYTSQLWTLFIRRYAFRRCFVNQIDHTTLYYRRFLHAPTIQQRSTSYVQGQHARAGSVPTTMATDIMCMSSGCLGSRRKTTTLIAGSLPTCIDDPSRQIRQELHASVVTYDIALSV